MPQQSSPHDEFLMWVGICITGWAKIEEYLFRICAASLGTTDERAAIVYYRTPSLESRLKLVDELVKTVLPKKDRPSGGHDHPTVVLWDALRKNLGNLLPVRNRIAHHPVTVRSVSAGDDAPLEAMTWFELYVSDSERLRGRDNNVKTLMVDDLSRHRLAVEDVRTRLRKFLDSLPKPGG